MEHKNLTLENIALNAFKMQTFSKVNYKKSDVRKASEKWDIYEKSPSQHNLEELLAAVNLCVQYQRSNFKEFANALESVAQNQKGTATPSKKSNGLR